MADRASDLLAAASALAYLREVRAGEAPEAARLSDRVRGLAAELVTTQNGDGGWPWIAPRGGQTPPASDRMASSSAALAIEAARSVGLLADPSAVDHAVTFLQGEFLKAGGDLERPGGDPPRPGQTGPCQLRAGQRPEPVAAGARQFAPRPPGPGPGGARPPGVGRRGARPARHASQARGGRARPEAPDLLGSGRPPGHPPPGGRRGHRAGRLGLRHGPARGRRGRGGGGMAPGPSPGQRLDAGPGPGARRRRPGGPLGPAPGRRAIATAWSSASAAPRSPGSRSTGRPTPGRSSSPASCSSPARPRRSGSPSRGGGPTATP